MAFASAPVSSFQPYLNSCPDFLQLRVILKCKSNKPFPYQLALVMVFHHSNNNPKTAAKEVQLSSGLYKHAHTCAWTHTPIYTCPCNPQTCTYIHTKQKYPSHSLVPMNTHLAPVSRTCTVTGIQEGKLLSLSAFRGLFVETHTWLSCIRVSKSDPKNNQDEIKSQDSALERWLNMYVHALLFFFHPPELGSQHLQKAELTSMCNSRDPMPSFSLLI